MCVKHLGSCHMHEIYHFLLSSGIIYEINYDEYVLASLYLHILMHLNKILYLDPISVQCKLETDPKWPATKFFIT